MRRKNEILALTFCAIVLASFGAMSREVRAQTPSLSVPSTTPSISVTTSPAPTESPVPSPTPKDSVLVTTATVGTQYPWNKQIPIKIFVTPSISGKQLQIRWQRQASLTGKPTLLTLQNPQAGKTYTFSFTLTPHSTGYQRAVADVILITNTTNYVSSKDIPLQLDGNKVVLPITGSYVTYKIGMYVILVFVFLVVIPFICYRIYLYITKVLIPKWLAARIKSPL